MRFSVITASHDPKYLKETIDSVIAQTYKDWEMVIVPNNGAKVGHLVIDPRIIVVDFPVGATNIGQIKKFAFSQGQGDVLVELDHDDVLAPNCLEELAKAYDKGAEFVYSQCAYFRDDFSKPTPTKPFDPASGWTYKTLPNGLIVQDMFQLTPKMLAYIYFAPDHVRSFTRALYEKVGGHNHQLSICDDQELMIRMYLAGAKFECVNQCLYFYRRHDENSFVKRQDGINHQTMALRDQYLEAICLEWSRRNGLKAIDVGSGINPRKGFLSVDIDGGEITADLRERWPFDDSSVGVIWAQDLLEHLPDKMHTMKEIHRVLAHGGILLSKTPAFPGAGAVCDPTHVSYWNEMSFWYFTRKEQAQYIKNTTIRFQEDRLLTMFPNEWCRDNGVSYVVADLVALKDGPRIPGSIKI